MAPRGARRRGPSAARISAVIAVGLALVGCASDDGDADPVDEPVSTEQSTPDESGSAGAVSDEATDDSTDGDGDADTADDDETSASSDDGDTSDDATITTTPPATTVAGSDSGDSDASEEIVAPVTVPGPTVASDLDEEADFGTGVVASVLEVEAVQVEGRLPGERTGPGVLVTIEVDNGSDEQISLDFVTVDLLRADGSSAIPVESPEHTAFSGELEPGASAVASYQFFLPVEQRESATITVSYASGVATALFSGDLPDV